MKMSNSSALHVLARSRYGRSQKLHQLGCAYARQESALELIEEAKRGIDLPLGEQRAGLQIERERAVRNLEVLCGLRGDEAHAQCSGQTPRGSQCLIRSRRIKQ